MSDPAPSPTDWTTPLLDWFARHQRPMPWRNAPTPYRVWISEIMLQQTQVATVIPYFNRFIARFPQVGALADAAPEAVLKQWEGLGYYTRARNLHRAARIIAHDRGGAFPSTYADWLTLPGVGPYTAAAIASIAGGEAVPAVDGNVLRVFARTRGCRDDVAAPATRTRLFNHLQVVLESGLPAGDFNQAVMEIGALICRPRHPDCAVCPLAPGCVARREGRTAELPVKTRPKRGPRYQVATVALTCAGRILLVRRPEQGLLGGLWELPHARRDGREPMRATAERAVREACPSAISCAAGLQKHGRLTHAFSHFSETLHLFSATLAPPPPPLGAAMQWISRTAAAELPLTTATRNLIDRLSGRPAPRPCRGTA